MRYLSISAAVLLVPAAAFAGGHPSGIAECKGPAHVTIDWDHDVVTLNGQSHAMQLEKLGKHTGVSLHGDGITLNVLKGKDGDKNSFILLSNGTETHLQCQKHG